MDSVLAAKSPQSENKVFFQKLVEERDCMCTSLTSDDIKAACSFATADSVNAQRR